MNVNPMQLIKMFIGKGGTPEQFLNQALTGNKNPMFSELMNMAKNGDQQSIENFARNVFKEQGRDFDSEFSDFIKQIKR